LIFSKERLLIEVIIAVGFGTYPDLLSVCPAFRNLNT